MSEQGTPARWDSAWHEGYAHAIEEVLAIPYKAAWLRSRDYWKPRRNWRTRLAQWLLRRAG